MEFQSDDVSGDLVHSWQWACGTLSFIYAKFGHEGPYRLKNIEHEKDQTVTQIALASIWINKNPAEYLKWFNSSPMGDQINKVEIINDNFYFESIIDGQSNYSWNWYKHKKETAKPITVAIRFNKKNYKFNTVTWLKVAGLKKMIKDDEYLKIISFDVYALYKGEDELVDYNTLEESLIGNEVDKNEVEIILKDTSVRPDPHQQKATSDNLMLTSEFKAYCSTMTERGKIVCLIRHGEFSASGFLIGKDLIMTCAHTFSNEIEKPSRKILKNATAKFFYDDKDDRKTVTVTLEEIICWSPTPKIGQANKNALDYAVIRFSIGKNLFHWRRLLHAAKIARDFFKLPETGHNTQRANILQYPIKKSLSQHISFRENRITRNEQFLLHYQSTTHPGSSGSPVINDKGEFLGMHASECCTILQNLFLELPKLIQMLDLKNPNPTIDNSYSFTNRDIAIYHEGDNIGYYSDNKNNKKYLINQLVNGDQILTLCKTSVVKDHSACNTAIKGVRIFEHIKMKDTEKIIESSQKFLPYELIISWVYLPHAILFGAGIGIGILVVKKLRS